MTPFGHISISYLAGKSHNKALISALLIGSIIPDIDLLLLPLPWGNSLHRTFTHSLLFIVTISALSLPVPVIKHKLQFFSSLLAGGFLHILADSIIDSNATNGVGVKIFFPFSDYYFSPFNLSSHTQENVHGWNEPLQQFSYIIKDFAWEIPVIIAGLVVSYLCCDLRELKYIIYRLKRKM